MARESSETLGPPPEPLRIRTTLQPRGPAAAVILDEHQVARIGGATKSPPVRCTVNGHTFAGRIARMGGESLLGFNRAVREAVGVEAGDEIDLLVVLDPGPREVEVPDELVAALAEDERAKVAFAGLAYTHRKEFSRWVAEAKRPETRQRRVGETIAMLREGRTRS